MGEDTPRNEVRERLSDLPDDQLELLAEETRDILDSHGDVQREHRDQAKWFLRVYMAGIGILLAVFAWVGDFLRKLALPAADSVALTEGVLIVFVFSMSAFGVSLLVRAFFRFAGTLELVVAVLSPERFENNSFVLTLVGNFRWYAAAVQSERLRRRRVSESKETVERVVEADTLIGSLEDPSRKQDRILTDRLCRIQRNEKSINRNMDRLTSVYRITSVSLADSLAGGFLLVIASLPVTYLI